MEPGESRRPAALWHRLQIRARWFFNRAAIQRTPKNFVLTLLIGAVWSMAAVCFHLLLELFQRQIIYQAAAMDGWPRVPLVIIIPV